MIGRRIIGLAVVAMLLLPAVAAQGLSGPPCDFLLTARNAGGKTGSLAISNSSWRAEGYAAKDTQHIVWVYSSSSPIDIKSDSGDVIGTISTLSLSADEDPEISVNFACTAGSTPTTFSFSNSMPVNIPNGNAYATAGLTLTDRYQDGASITGLLGGKCYQATYNSPSVEFASLISGFGITTNPRTLTSCADYGWSHPGVPVSYIASSFSFTLSAWDSASGTSSYQIEETPEPGSIAAMIIGLTSLMGLRTRKRNTRL